MRTINLDEDLQLTEISLASAQLIYDSIQRSRTHLKEWLPFVDSTKSVNDTRNFIKSVINSTCPKRDIIFEIRFKEYFAGLVGFKEIDHANGKTEIGYWLDKSMTGKGIMIRSCKALISYAFEELNLNRIMIKVATNNNKSKAIPLALGFLTEGIERDGEYLHNQYNDLEVYSILKNEWKT